MNPLAGLADLLENSDFFPYEDIPGFPVSTVPGHQSRLLFGLLKDIPVMLMQGRFHSYEGYPLGLVSTQVLQKDNGYKMQLKSSFSTQHNMFLCGR